MFSKFCRLQGCAKNVRSKLFETFKRSAPVRFNVTHATKAVEKTGASIHSPPQIVGWWLAMCGGMCFGAVALGGVTRLTESGLSMVDWRLFGRRPPLTQAEWNVEFEKYQTSPEFMYKNSDITMSDFKFIWSMEYGHRMWGRLIGAVFLVPAAVFLAKGWLTRPMKIRVGIMGSLIGFQGLLGWYMVKSGLDHENFANNLDTPRVSQYRLAAHLSTAMVLYSLFVSNALTVLSPKSNPIDCAITVKRLTKLAHGSKALVFVTAVSGAFVAGLDAGLVYNSFPKMGDWWIPGDLFSHEPLVRNVTENPTTVQFNHRILGTSTLLYCTYVAGRVYTTIAPLSIKKAAMALGAMSWIQATLGISTLLMYVPTSLAALHQSGALLTLTAALVFSHRMKMAKLVGTSLMK